MNEQEALRILNKYNPWWAGKEIPKSKLGTFKRRDFFSIKKELLQKQITSILGPRRVGKTILLHQLIQDLLEQKVEPERILYLSVDEDELKRAETSLNDILEIYSKFIVKKPIDSLDKRHYVFLDEIQSVNRWSIVLKNWYDLGYNIKFVISGSSSMALSRGAMESLLGRLNRCVLLPLKFSEMLRYKKVFDTYDFRDVRQSFINAIINNKHELLFAQFQDLFSKTVSIEDKIEILLNRYIVVGGYPELLEEDDYARISQIMQEKIESTFYKDIALFFKIRNSKALDELFSNLAMSSSQKFNIANAAKDLDIERPTLKVYLEHFLDIFLISMSEFYSKSRRVRSRKAKKIYVNDPGIRNAAIGYLDDILIQDTKEVGQIVEGIVFDHLKRLKFILERGPEPEVFYWESNKKEVNFVIEVKRKAIPIELKYQSEITGSDTLGLKEFIKEFNPPFGILITKNLLKAEGKILFIPLWLFLLMI